MNRRLWPALVLAIALGAWAVWRLATSDAPAPAPLAEPSSPPSPTQTVPNEIAPPSTEARNTLAIENPSALDALPRDLWRTRIEGTVLDEEGRALHEARVELHEYNSEIAPPLHVRLTDVDGAFVFVDPHRLSPSRIRPSGLLDFRLHASAPGRLPSDAFVQLSANDPIAEPAMTLERAEGFIAGIVWDDEDRAIPGAEIRRDRPVQLIEADGMGRFRLPVPVSEEIYLYARRPGEHWQRQGDFMAGEEEVVLRIGERARREGVISGRVLGWITGEPIVGLTLSNDERTIVADKEGRFRFEGLTMGRNWIRAEFPPGQGAVVTKVLTPEKPTAEVELAHLDRVDLGGRVTDVVSGQPVADLRFHLEQWSHAYPSVVTDRDGRFEIPDALVVRRSQPDVVIESGPWLFADARPMYMIDNEERLNDLNFRVREGDIRVIEARDPEGAPLPGAAILIAAERTPDTLGITDHRGQLQATLPRDLPATDLFGRHADWPRIVTDSIVDDPIIMRAEPLRQLTVHVVTERSEPVEGASVVCSAAVAPDVSAGDSPAEGGEDPLRQIYDSSLQRGMTDSGGTVILADLAPDIEDVTLAVDAHGARASEIIALLQDLNHEVTITVEPLVIRGDVVSNRTPPDFAPGTAPNPHLEPLPGATVRWSDSRNEVFGAGAAVLTGADGRFEIPWHPAPAGNPPVLLAEADGHSPQPTQAWRLLRHGEAHFQLRPSIEIRGRMISALGNVPRFAGIWVLRPIEHPRTNDPPLREGEAFTGWRGERVQRHAMRESSHFEIHLDPPAFETPAVLLFIGYEADLAAIDLMLTPDAPRVIDLGTVRLAEGHDLQGRVVMPDGSPAENCPVRWEHHTSSPGTRDNRWRVRTEPDGRFELQGLPPGHWRLFVTRPDRQLMEIFEVDLPHEGELTLQLPPLEGTPLTVRFHPPPGEAIDSARMTLRDARNVTVATAPANDNDVAHLANAPEGEFDLSLNARTESQIMVHSEPIRIGTQALERELDMRDWHLVTLHATVSGEETQEGGRRVASRDRSLTILPFRDAGVPLAVHVPEGSHIFTATIGNPSVASSAEFTVNGAMEVWVEMAGDRQ